MREKRKECSSHKEGGPERSFSVLRWERLELASVLLGRSQQKRERTIDSARFLGRQNGTGSRTQEEALALNRSRDHSGPTRGKEGKKSMGILRQVP